jgi:hypothetical protein
MNKISILTNKHTGIIFTPRSGSHVLREFLSSVNNTINGGEIFNPTVISNVKEDNLNNFLLKGNRKFRHLGLSNDDSINLKTCEQDDIENIETLTLEASLSNYFVFTINSTGYQTTEYRENILKRLANSNNIQCFRLKRADVLWSFLSIWFARISQIWHQPYENINVYKPESLKIPLGYIIKRLQMDLENDKDIDKYFPDIPTIYYEQFQNNVNNLRNLFEGIPKKIVSNPYTKLGINYKEYVENIDEIEDYYEQFVNDNKEYYPQYFGKLPHVTIPASQGRQPRDLSQLKMAVGI